MGQMDKMQAQMKETLRTVECTGEAGDGQVVVTANGVREIINIHIAPELVAEGDAEAIEDLLMVAANRALEQAAAEEAKQGQMMMNSMLPGGLGSLFGG